MRSPWKAASDQFQFHPSCSSLVFRILHYHIGITRALYGSGAIPFSSNFTSLVRKILASSSGGPASSGLIRFQLRFLLRFRFVLGSWRRNGCKIVTHGPYLYKFARERLWRPRLLVGRAMSLNPGTGLQLTSTHGVISCVENVNFICMK